MFYNNCNIYVFKFKRYLNRPNVKSESEGIILFIIDRHRHRKKEQKL